VHVSENSITRPTESAPALGCSVHTNRGQDKQLKLSGVNSLSEGKPDSETSDAQLQVALIVAADDDVCKTCHSK
jgi:hypothetical protein